MNKKTKGLLAGAAGAALLLGGGTFALWSDSAEAPGGTITAGNLDVAVVGTPTWTDISEDRKDAGHAIDLETFRIIPGDTIEGTFGFTAALEGENMVAQLAIDGSEAAGELLQGLDIKVSIDGQSVDWDGDEPIEVMFASADNNTGDNPHDLKVVSDEEFDVTVTVHFDNDTRDQDLTQTSAVLGDLTVSLEQVRTNASGYIG